MTESKTKIFISYARGDVATARRLYRDLKAAGAAPWMDEEDLLPGQVWETAITRAIRESRFFIALLSSHSVGKRGFFHSELKKALKILDRFPPGEIFFIPSRIDECELPDDIAHIHCADLSPSYEEGFEKILKVIAAPQQLEEKPAGKGTVEAAPEGRTAGDIINIHAGGDVVFAKDQGAVSVNQPVDEEAVVFDKTKIAGSLFRKVCKIFKRFIVKDNQGTVLDNKTGLMWSAKDNGKDVSWRDAKTYCKNCRIGGYIDWRMPSSEELRELYEAGINKSQKKGPIFISSFFIWTSDLKNSSAGCLDFGGGWRSWVSENFHARALPVRDSH